MHHPLAYPTQTSLQAIFWDRAGLTNHARAIHPRHKIMTREKQDADGKPKKNVGGKINAKDRPAVKGRDQTVTRLTNY
jgi:hypothetical protein